MRWLPVLVFAAVAWAHAPITPAARGPLRVEGVRLVDAAGDVTQLRGAVVPNADAATVATLGVMRLRWNLNAVRIPVETAAWQREGRPYLERAVAAVARARDADLIAILAPDALAAGFWEEWALRFRDTPNVVFSLFRAGAAQQSFDAIRRAGARQVVAVPVEADVRGDNVIYEARLPLGVDPPTGRQPLLLFPRRLLCASRAAFAAILPATSAMPAQKIAAPITCARVACVAVIAAVVKCRW